MYQGHKREADGYGRRHAMSCIEHVLIDKDFLSGRECVNILHHASGPMDDGEVVSEKFLGPTTDNMDLTIII